GGGGAAAGSESCRSCLILQPLLVGVQPRIQSALSERRPTLLLLAGVLRVSLLAVVTQRLAARRGRQGRLQSRRAEHRPGERCPLSQQLLRRGGAPPGLPIPSRRVQRRPQMKLLGARGLLHTFCREDLQATRLLRALRTLELLQRRIKELRLRATWAPAAQRNMNRPPLRSLCDRESLPPRPGVLPAFLSSMGPQQHPCLLNPGCSLLSVDPDDFDNYDSDDFDNVDLPVQPRRPPPAVPDIVAGNYNCIANTKHPVPRPRLSLVPSSSRSLPRLFIPPARMLIEQLDDSSDSLVAGARPARSCHWRRCHSPRRCQSDPSPACSSADALWRQFSTRCRRSLRLPADWLAWPPLTTAKLCCRLRRPGWRLPWPAGERWPAAAVRGRLNTAGSLCTSASPKLAKSSSGLACSDGKMLALAQRATPMMEKRLQRPPPQKRLHLARDWSNRAGELSLVHIVGRPGLAGLSLSDFADLLLRLGMEHAVSLETGDAGSLMVNGTLIGTRLLSAGGGGSSSPQFACLRPAAAVLCISRRQQQLPTPSSSRLADAAATPAAGSGGADKIVDLAVACRDSDGGGVQRNRRRRCLCLNGGVCQQPDSEACRCRPGFTGSLCELPCPAGFYGQDCARVCVCGGGESVGLQSRQWHLRRRLRPGQECLMLYDDSSE
uniref:EGF-like domain-containing protein n=1 Tax=Macrostomum lignano TaxID=282301 RepID=A0A1I8FNA1_9PLAT